MDKENLVKRVDEAIRDEEVAIQIYSAHVSNILQWSGLDSKTQQDIAKKLQKLVDESIKHKKYFEQMKRKI